MKLTPMQIIGIILIVNGALIGATSQLTDAFGPQVVKYIVLFASLGNSIFGGVITMLSGQGSMVRTVLAMPGVEKIDVNGQAGSALAMLAVDPAQNKIAPTAAALDKVTATAKAALVLLAIVVAGLFAFSGVASAQGVLKPLRPLTARAQVAVPAAKPAAVSASTGLQKFMDDLAALQKKVVDDVVADLAAADADAATLTDPSNAESYRDPIAHACYPAATKFLQSLPAASPATGNLVVVQLFQKQRDFVAQIQSGLPVYLKLGCAPLLGDEVQIFTKVMGLVGVTVAANSLLPGISAIMPVLP